MGSLNSRQVDEELIALLQKSGQDRITIAPETNEESRWKIGKGYVTDELVFRIVRLANKYSLPLSLYLMYGLPGETNKEMTKLGQFVRKVRQILDDELDLQVHFNQVYFKAHTPWQYAGQIIFTESAFRLKLFRRQFADLPGIENKTLDSYSAIIQSLLARGDKQMGVLLADIAFSPPRSIKELTRRMQDLIPDWQQYFKEKKSPEIPWSRIVFQDHEMLWQRWLSFKDKLNKEGERL